MPRRFNTAGPCRPDWHYMIPAERRLPEAPGLVEQRGYFVVHAPRQTGKTTALRALAEELTASGQYAALLVSCEAGQAAGDDYQAALREVLAELSARAAGLPVELRPPPGAAGNEAGLLRGALTTWAAACPRPIVLILDEIDALRDASLIAILRQLRAGYADRPERFPASVILCGLRDVRDYKAKSGGDPSRLGTASPFNIKLKSLRLGDFSEAEVRELYAQHTADTGQVFTQEALARAFQLTRGQPWLVNALGQEIVEEMAVPPAEPITAAHVERAKDRLVLSRATHLDCLADKLREPRVQRVVEPVLAGRQIDADVPRDDLDYALDLGLIARDAAGNLGAANPIYREVIPRELGSVTADIMVVPARSWKLPDGRLDVDGLLDAFVAFWRRHAEPMVKSQSYSEVACQIVLMAYLQRVVNGGAMIEREYAAGSGRMDLAIRWPLPGGEQLVAIELKVWREKQADPLAEGLAQVEGYLGRLGLKEGFLVIFDRRRSAEEIPWDERPRWEEAALPGGVRVRVLRL